MLQQGACGPHPVDVHVGSRLRTARLLKGLSQAALGDRLGVTFQQIQKYERGTNRMSASMLWYAADALSVPVAYFFDRFTPDQPAPLEVRPKADEIALVRHFRRFPKRLRRTLADLAEVIAEGTPRRS